MIHVQMRFFIGMIKKGADKKKLHILIQSSGLISNNEKTRTKFPELIIVQIQLSPIGTL